MALWNVFMALALFVVFYLCGLVVRFPLPFFSALIAVHVADFVWFTVSLNSRGASRRLKTVMKTFVWIDVFTVVGLGITITCRHLIQFTDWRFVGIGTCVMIVMGVVDFIANRSFFFHPDEWKNMTEEP